MKIETNYIQIEIIPVKDNEIGNGLGVRCNVSNAEAYAVEYRVSGETSRREWLETAEDVLQFLEEVLDND